MYKPQRKCDENMLNSKDLQTYIYTHKMRVCMYFIYQTQFYEPKQLTLSIHILDISYNLHVPEWKIVDK